MSANSQVPYTANAVNKPHCIKKNKLQSWTVHRLNDTAVRQTVLGLYDNSATNCS